MASLGLDWLKLKCDHSAEDKHTNGVGGCLYILSADHYCVVNVKVPDNTYKVNINVTGDNPPGGMIDGNVNNVQVGTIGEKNGNVSFIVRQGATVNYTVSKDHYNTKTGSFTAGANLNNKNEHDVEIQLSKTILTHTIACSGATIKVTGKFTDDTGKVISNSASGTTSVTFKVWSGENSANYTVSKKYYNSRTGSVNVTSNSNGKKTNVTLDKTKYYSNNQDYTLHKIGNSAKWNEKTKLNGSGDAELKLYRKDEYGTITLTFNGDTNDIKNWKLYIKGYKVGQHPEESQMKVTVLDKNGKKLINEKVYKFAKKDTAYDTEITLPNNNSMKTVTIKFVSGKRDLSGYRFWLSSVYAEIIE